MSLINISAKEEGAAALLNLSTEECPPLQKPPGNIVVQCLDHIFNKDSRIADQCCMILSNLTRPKHLIEKIVDIIEDSDRTFDSLIEIFTKIVYNKGANLHYLGPVLSNLSQSSRVRAYILEKDKCTIQRLLPFTEYKDSLVRRGGIVGKLGCKKKCVAFSQLNLLGTLKNCCFESDFHEWLLSEEVDILPRLLLPLAGPEEFDEEDNDKLPLELQYLPSDKSREEDPDIRYLKKNFFLAFC